MEICGRRTEQIEGVDVKKVMSIKGIVWHFGEIGFFAVSHRVSWEDTDGSHYLCITSKVGQQPVSLAQHMETKGKSLPASV